MQIGILGEHPEARVALVPETVKKLSEAGNTVLVEKGAGESSFYSNSDFEAAGARIADKAQVLSEGELLLPIHPPAKKDFTRYSGKTLVSSFQPFADAEVSGQLSAAGVTALSLDMIPRSTLAQSMDILSSMASIAGYKAVLAAAALLPRYFPMLTTAAGTIPPTKVLVLGAGVAGLQAIATAKRLGAVVEAFDTRLAAREEVQSLGAKFVEVPGARDEKGAGGYAVEQSEEYRKKQSELVAEKVGKSDVVITTAQLRGRPAPLLVTKEMMQHMRAGSVIVDLAASSGGNCEATVNNQTVLYNNVYVIGNSSLATEMPMHASQLYSKNLLNFLNLVLKEGQLHLDFENEIVKNCCIAHQGEALYQAP